MPNDHDPASPRHGVITGRDQIAMFHLLQLRGALSLENRGIKHKQGSVYGYVKRLLDLTGTRHEVLDKLDDLIQEVKRGELIYELGKGVKKVENERDPSPDRTGRNGQVPEPNQKCN